MESPKILEIVKRVIATELEVPIDELSDDASLRDAYGLDSVAAVNIVFQLESELDVEIDIRQFAHVDSIGQLRAVLAQGLVHKEAT